MGKDLHYKSLLDVAGMIKRREVSCVEVVSEHLERIEAYESKLNAFILVMGESALADAKAADADLAKGLYRGPLHGVPIGVKDLLDVKGTPTTGGTKIMKDKYPEIDATVVARLKQAGAIVIGKVHMTEGATLSHHPMYKRPDNPWKSGYWTGVSSSGSGVSVAAGFCYGALGSDTGGSIRMPSYANGLSGIKPTWGRVSRHGVFPLAETFDHIGPMCRTAADAAAMLQAMAGQDALDPTAINAPVPDYLAELGPGISNMLIAVDWSLLEDRVHPSMVAAMKAAAKTFEGLGARIREVTLPPIGPSMAPLMPLLMAEVRAAHEETYPALAADYGPDLAGMLEGGGMVSGVDVAKANIARTVWNGALRKVFDEADILLIPASPAPTPTWDEVDALKHDMGAMMDRIGRYTLPFNASGSPTLSLPCGFEAGMPLGLQLVGPHLSEHILCRAGAAFQTATDFHTVHPEL